MRRGLIFMVLLGVGTCERSLGEPLKVAAIASPTYEIVGFLGKSLIYYDGLQAAYCLRRNTYDSDRIYVLIFSDGKLGYYKFKATDESGPFLVPGAFVLDKQIDVLIDKKTADKVAGVVRLLAVTQGLRSAPPVDSALPIVIVSFANSAGVEYATNEIPRYAPLFMDLATRLGNRVSPEQIAKHVENFFTEAARAKP